MKTDVAEDYVTIVVLYQIVGRGCITKRSHEWCQDPHATVPK